MNFRIIAGNRIAIKSSNFTILLDPKISDFISFVTHSHADHSPNHIISPPHCTPETCDLLRVSNPFLNSKTLRIGKTYKLNDDLKVKLLNAGHMLGSSQVLLDLGEKTILYSGDVKLEPSLTCKPIDIEEADILIVEATYGTPKYKLPSMERVREDFVSWVKEKLRKGKKIEVGAYPVGKSQEAIKILNEEGIVPKVTETIRRYSEVYQKHGVKLEFVSRREESDVLIKPIGHTKRKDPKAVSCVLTGWVKFGVIKTFGFPLSDHCDFKQLLEYIERVNPKEVYCVHGYEKELAKAIRKKLGIKAFTLTNPKQS